MTGRVTASNESTTGQNRHSDQHPHERTDAVDDLLLNLVCLLDSPHPLKQLSFSSRPIRRLAVFAMPRDGPEVLVSTKVEEGMIWLNIASACFPLAECQLPLIDL